MARPIAGRLRGHYEPGTIVGPNTTREYLAALPADGRVADGYTAFGYATVAEIDAANERSEPWSVAEAKLRPVRGAQH